MRQVLQRKESNYLRMKRAKLKKKHFKKIKKIGAGAYGEVSLVRSNASVTTRQGMLYAMKTIKKSSVVEKNHFARVIAERDILGEADNEWITKLFYSFQVRFLFLLFMLSLINLRAKCHCRTVKICTL